MGGSSFLGEAPSVPSSGSSSDRRPPVAVALRYAPPADRAPRVVASGRGAIAERILELARAHGIAVREDADLAETLAAVAVAEQIPVAAFAVVAEILFYILRANRQLPVQQEKNP